MGLPKGFGLVVDYVVPDSPAAAAGVQQNDILRMLNDQILLEPNQLRKLLQSFPDGTTVTLTILRKGQEQKLTAKLTKKDVSKRNAWMGHGDFDFHMPDMNDMNIGDLGNLKEEMKERMEAMKEQLKEQANERKDMIRETVMKAQEAAERAREVARQIRDKQIQVQNATSNGLQTTRIDVNKAQIVFTDDKGEIRLETLGDKKILTVKDPKGVLQFSGPVDTPEEIGKLPGPVRQRFDQLQQNTLPSVVNSDQSMQPDDEDDDDDSDDADDNDSDDSSNSTEQVSISPQQFPRSLLPLHTILI
jgi:hypothetical protein